MFLVKALPTDQPTYWPTDTAYYRDARTHLKSEAFKGKVWQNKVENSNIINRHSTFNRHSAASKSFTPISICFSPKGWIHSSGSFSFRDRSFRWLLFVDNPGHRQQLRIWSTRSNQVLGDSVSSSRMVSMLRNSRHYKWKNGEVDKLGQCRHVSGLPKNLKNDLFSWPSAGNILINWIEKVFWSVERGALRTYVLIFFY